ncbi:hypothetical protein HY478_03475 [Candidatus Uhrbacteria bacterium]|nr:hypothetical protein [Candidatus Uhrbacteria bacterium]
MVEIRFPKWIEVLLAIDHAQQFRPARAYLEKLAVDLDMPRTHVQRIVRALIEQGLVEPHEKAGRKMLVVTTVGQELVGQLRRLCSTKYNKVNQSWKKSDESKTTE